MTTSKSIDWLNRETYNASSLATINWEKRTLIDSNPIFSVDWERKCLNAYDLVTSGATLSVDWQEWTLYDKYQFTSVDWSRRRLYSLNGNTALNWFDDTFLDSNVYQRDYKSAAIQNAVSNNYNNPYASYLGDVIESDGIVTYIDSSVTEGMLVNLDSGTWTPVDQASTKSTLLLGIAHNLVPSPPNLSGFILLEGHVVIDDTSTAGPYVASAGYGLPIYIKDSTTTGEMSTVVPTTTGGPNIVRILGHCYQQNGGSNSQWMMKFRPSNDWVEI